ncbi:ornithine decarboxylase-like protein [Leptotrombidium deliense]|uniref:Ornithine decarboxylase-like protein n=1 Tax=Leptotrombidium deliense TaxID=299467 RepID=A0A443RW95_9ACAR|nr:ornithine decarboxylase-like protein [Leptotrombidium deliense]
MSSVRKLIQQAIATKNFDDPFYVVDIEDIIEKHNRWIKPYYVVKCNNTLIVLEILASLRFGFDCRSKW